MGTPAFDTYKEIKRLTEAGADEPLAAAVVAAIGTAVSGELATKADLKNLELATKADLKNLGQEIKVLEQEIKVFKETTKADLKNLGQEIKILEQEIKVFKETTKAEINDLKQYMIIRLGGMFVVAVGIMIAATAVLR